MNNAPKSIDLTNAEVKYHHSFFADAEQLYQQVNDTTAWKQENVVIWGKSVLQPRLVAWHGDIAYTYSGLTVEPQPLTAVISEIKQRVEVATGTIFNSVLLNYYRDGKDSMGWHSDNEAGVGPIIASVSFGAARRFLLRDIETKTVRAELSLGNGDLLVMGAGTQEHYQHSVPKTAKPIGPRINLTFRQMG
jgi:alkylated DNA repair dioxygenase AlkB